MKKLFSTPELELVRFLSEDILTDSGDLPDLDLNETPRFP